MQKLVEGFVDPDFHTVKTCFEQLWDDVEVGAAIAVYKDGEPVVNLWGGSTDRDQTKPWQQDTLVNVYSATKGLAAITFALLVDDGLVSYDDLVIEFWPEFAANGKAKVSIAELLSHRAGICAVDETLQVSDLFDQTEMARRLAAQQPFWPPGEQAGYHAVTWGFLVAELVKRISGESLGQLFQRRIAQPLKLNTYIGLPITLHKRCAELIGPNHASKKASTNSQQSTPSPLYLKTLSNPPISPFKHACSADWRQAEIPASNGHSDALSLAKLYGLLAYDQKLIKPSVLAAATKLEVDQQPDVIMGTVIRRSRGFIMSSDGNYGPAQNAFGHAGAGGSMAFADPERNIGFAYVMNQMQSDSQRPNRADRLIEAVFQCL